jgi:chaperonin GroES
MNFTPLNDRILVKRADEETKTASGLIIPDSAREKPLRGTVLAVGKGNVADDGSVRPLAVKAGDDILFGKYAGTEIKIEGTEHTILREDDILGIVED